MVLVNVQVYCSSLKRTISPWQIMSPHPPDVSFLDFFQNTIAGTLEKPCELESVYVERSKDILDVADKNLNLAEVVATFGSYIKLVTREPSSDTATATSEPVNAFQIMFASQRRLNQRSLPPRKEPVRTKKDKLRNDLLVLLEQNELSWKMCDVPSVGEQLIGNLTETLWYVDGHHDVFRSRGFQLPSVFSIFIGYNTPEASKHRKRKVGNLSGEIIANHAKHLFTCLQCSYWAIPAWHTFRDDVESLARSLSGYADYLGKKNKQMKFLHSQLQPVRTVGDNLQFQYLPSASVVLPDFEELERALKAKNQFQSLQLESLCPQNPSKRYEFLKKLKNIGLPFPTAMLTYSHGNNVGSLNFLWCVSDKSDSTFSSCQGVIESVKEMLPVYKTRAMRSAAFNKFGRLTSNLTPIAFRYIYKDLTGDHSAPANLDQAEIEKRVRLLVDMEDADVVLDLRHLNSGRKSMYDAFWDESSKFIQDSIGQAVDDRRHQQVTHLATAISVNDFVTQVSRRCPDGTQIPSEAWVRLQFWPKNKHHKSSCHYTGKLNVKFMVQSRQLRKSHDDAHYCAALFRYEREQAILLRDNSMFACLDDKHRIPVGEPGYPVASVERGRRVIVSRNTDFLVADHDFTRFSIVPSVTLFVDIPDEISESWYTGQVYVTLKEGSMEPSSPLRHATELVANIQSEFSDVKPVLFFYTDGGPDHRITYLSVQLSLISVFLSLDLDYLCAVRTAPAQSWKNPVERIMSILNLGLQSVGLMREQGSEQAEQSLKNCNNLTQIRAAVANNSNLAGEISDSIEPVKILLSDIFQRLHLKDKAVKVSPSATQTRMEELNKNLDAIEEVSLTEKTPKSILKKLPKLAAFIDHCCQSRSL